VHGTAIGTVTGTGRMRVFDGEDLVGDMPVRALVDDCPLYDLAPVEPSEPIYAPPVRALAVDAPPLQTLLALLGSPNIASRRPLFEQYDAVVQSRTVRRPEQADAAVLALDRDPYPSGDPHPPGAPHPAGEGRPIPGLAVSIDCNGRRVAADPYRGTIEAALECAANLACVGAEPLGTTNNLNFGNPEKGHIAWQLTESVRGLGDACRALQAPIVGGNVSLYNEGQAAGPIYPTPVVGMVGRIPDVRRAGRLGFARAGDAVALVGPFVPSLQASELAKLRGEPLPDGLPGFELDAVVVAQGAVRDAVRAGACSSVHDIAEGGLAVALAECCLAGEIGAQVEVDGSFWEAMFGEGPGGFVVSGPVQALRDLGEKTAVQLIGTVGGEALRIAHPGKETVNATLAELKEVHGALAELFA
jgi:phosphoribosylformylglycinamidine (FGAM) synthase-like enzyme